MSLQVISQRGEGRGKKIWRKIYSASLVNLYDVNIELTSFSASFSACAKQLCMMMEWLALRMCTDFLPAERFVCVPGQSCDDWRKTGGRTGVYAIELPDSEDTMTVWCDMDSGNGSWLVRVLVFVSVYDR